MDIPQHLIEHAVLDLNGVYLKLDATNSPITGLLIINVPRASSTNRILDLQVAGSTKWYLQENGASAWTNNVTMSNGTAINTSSNGTLYFCNTATTGTGDKTKMSVGGGTSTSSSGTIVSFTIIPTYNQTGTCANTDLLIKRTETAVGSGTQLLIDAQVGSTSKFNVNNTGTITIIGDLNHDGSNIGFFGTAPTAKSSAYTITNPTTNRTYDANSTTINELADIMATLINDLQAYGLIG